VEEQKIKDQSISKINWNWKSIILSSIITTI